MLFLSELLDFLSLQYIKKLVYLLKVQILKREVDFYYSSGFYTRPKNILFCWLVFFCSKSVEIIQETEKWLFY